MFRSLTCLGLLVCCSLAQDSRPDAAQRLHALVDRRVEELRAELHREIDAELGTEVPAGMTFGPVSAEFRELHRLSPSAGQRVEAVENGSQAERLGILAGDVFLRARALATASPTVLVIRKHERRRLPGAAAAMVPAAETADQMVDRLWDEAVRNATKTGLEEIRTGQPVPESQPVRK